jgi:hypothetical protein
MPQMPIFEKKGLNRKIKATTFGDEQGETEDWNKKPDDCTTLKGSEKSPQPFAWDTHTGSNVRKTKLWCN